jgi:hypothetical protein
MKDKKGERTMEQIKFEIANKMTMPNLLEKGYRREDITTLFESLEGEGFGVYTKGSRGKGNFAYFTPNNSCPSEYVVESKRKRYRKSNKVDTPERKSSTSTESECKTKKQQALFAMWELSKNIVLNPSATKVGYECEILGNQILTIHRIRGGGFDTMEQAVNKVWVDISSRVDGNVKDVVSSLMGNSFLILKW